MSMKSAVKNYFHTEGGILGAKAYLNYGFCGFGQNMIYGMMSSYLMFFYTDVFLIPSATVGTMFLVAKIWDAFNDPIMGTFVDKTRTKWGKMRPYLLFSPIPVALSTILLFTAPNLSDTGKIVYMYITYIAWGMIYTVTDVPFWSMSSVLTPHLGERTNLVSFTRMMAGVGMGLPVVVISLLSMLQKNGAADSVIGTNKKMYFLVGLMMALGGAALLSRGFFGTKEVVPQNEKPPSFLQSMGSLVKNKPLLLLLLSNILQFPRLIQAGAMIYVATYILGGGEWVLVLGIPGTIAGIFSFLLVPPMVKKFGAIKTFLIANVVWILPTGLMFLVRPDTLLKPMNIVILFVLLFVASFAGGVIGILPTLLIADCVDYMEWKTNQRNEGVSFATQTFMAKVQSAMQSFAVGLLLVAVQFVQPVQEAGGDIIQQVQSASTLNGIWAMYTIIPAIGYVFCIIPLLFYDLKGKKLAQIQADLAQRRNLKN